MAEIRRRFGIDDPDCMCSLVRSGETVFVGLPEREALKIQDLWLRQEIGLELSVEVRARVVVGIYPMRIARYFMEGNGNGYHANGHAPGLHANGTHGYPSEGHGQPEDRPGPVAGPLPGSTAPVR